MRRNDLVGVGRAARGRRLGHALHGDLVDGAEEELVVGQALREVGQVGRLGEVGQDVGGVVEDAAEVGRLDVTSLSTASKADEPDVSRVCSPVFCWASTWTSAAVLARSCRSSGRDGGDGIEDGGALASSSVNCCW